MNVYVVIAIVMLLVAIAITAYLIFDDGVTEEAQRRRLRRRFRARERAIHSQGAYLDDDEDKGKDARHADQKLVNTPIYFD